VETVAESQPDRAEASVSIKSTYSHTAHQASRPFMAESERQLLRIDPQ
jgi:hypothetical protein